jgi:hypothetical protein
MDRSQHHNNYFLNNNNNESNNNNIIITMTSQQQQQHYYYFGPSLQLDDSCMSAITLDPGLAHEYDDDDDDDEKTTNNSEPKHSARTAIPNPTVPTNLLRNSSSRFQTNNKNTTMKNSTRAGVDDGNNKNNNNNMTTRCYDHLPPQVPTRVSSMKHGTIPTIPSRKPSLVAQAPLPKECFNLGQTRQEQQGQAGGTEEVQLGDTANHRDQHFGKHGGACDQSGGSGSIPTIPSRRPSICTVAPPHHPQGPDDASQTQMEEVSITAEELRHHGVGNNNNNMDSIARPGESSSEKRFAASSSCRTFGTAATTTGVTATPLSSPSLADHSNASSKERLDKLLPDVPVRRPSASHSHPLILDPLHSSSSSSSSGFSFHDDNNHQSISASTASNVVWDSTEHTSTASSIVDSSLLSSGSGVRVRSSITSYSIGGSTIFEDSTIIDFGDSRSDDQHRYYDNMLLLSNTSTILSESSTMHHSSSLEGSSFDTSSCFILDNPEQRFAPTLEPINDAVGWVRGGGRNRTATRRSSTERRRERAMTIANRHMYFSSMMSIDEDIDDISDSTASSGGGGGGEEEHDEIDHSGSVVFGDEHDGAVAETSTHDHHYSNQKHTHGDNDDDDDDPEDSKLKRIVRGVVTKSSMNSPPRLPQRLPSNHASRMINCEATAASQETML